MKEKILWLWQFPQNCLGWLYSKCAIHNDCYDGIRVYFAPCFYSGVSLGEYIILDPFFFGLELTQIIKHEYGHTKQSRMLGPLYLIVVGIPSIVRNIWSRLFHKSWSTSKREAWYYSGYPENWANKLGGVENETLS